MAAPTNMMIFPGAVPAAFCDRIITEGDKLALAKAKVEAPDGRVELIDKRDTLIARFEHEPRHQWLYDETWNIIQQLNANNWKFEINAVEPPQYTVYGPHQFFGWHRDNLPYASRIREEQSDITRKLSVSIQLNHGNEYQGGDFEVITDETQGTPVDDYAPATKLLGPQVTEQIRTKGTVIAFPSVFLHRVAPIISGTRKALVVWAGGPPADFDAY